MTNLKKSVRGWLPLTLVPLLSVTVLAGCGSDNDPTPTIADGFKPTAEAPDTDNNGIADIFQTPIDPDAVAADINTNNIDDSYEIAYSGGEDTDADGIDDAALAALVAAGLITLPETTDPETTDPETTDPETTDPETTDPETTDPETTEPETGDIIVLVSSGDTATGNFNWDGNNFQGTLDIASGASVNSAAIYTGIEAAGTGEMLFALNGQSPQLSVPNPLGAAQLAAISENINSGNLYLGVELADGNMQGGLIKLSAVTPTYTELTGAAAVPAVEAQSNGNAYMNVNTATGDLSIAVKIGLNAADNQTITAVHIHTGAVGEEGGVIVGLENPSGDQVTWTAVDMLTTEELSGMLAGDTYINVHGTDNSSFLRGQISVQ